jgi:hypothetical protein
LHTKEGEALWSEQFPLDALDRRQADLSEYAMRASISSGGGIG